MKQKIIQSVIPWILILVVVLGIGGHSQISFAQSVGATISGFTAQSNADGTQISFTASASAAATTTDFDYSLACGTSASSISGGPSASFGVPAASVTNPLALSGSLTIGTPYTLLSPTQPYYCELFDGGGTALTSPLMVSFGSGQLNIPYISSVTDTGATISINLGAGALPPNLYYGDSATSLTSPAISMGGLVGGTSFSGTISGLKANTTYYYQVFDGTTSSPIGDVQNFTTTNNGSGAGTPIEVIHGTIPTTLPTSQYTSGGLVSCGTATSTAAGVISDACDFKALMKMIDRFIGFLIFVIAPAIAALTLAYGGFLFATSGMNAENIGQAKGIMINALVGWLLAFAAWIIVKFVMVQLGYASNTAAGWLTFW